MPNLILTRNEGENSRLASEISHLGFEIISLPMIKQRDLQIDLSQYRNYKNVIITSKFAASITARNLRHNSDIFVVGDHSANILSKNSYINIKEIYNNVDELYDYLRDKFNDNYIYFRGNHIKKELKVREIIIYETEYFTDIISAPPTPDNILIYSEMTAKHFILFLKNHNLLKNFKKSVVIAISRQVAQIFDGISDNVYYSDNPNETIMLELLKRHGKK